MGEVWSGRHRDEPVPVAVKLLLRQGSDEAFFKAQVMNEVRAVAALDHPGVVRIFDQGQVSLDEARASRTELVEGTPYMVMELLRGGTLVSRVGKLEWPDFRFVMRSLLAALAHAHAHGVVHRDIKPGNVLFGVGDARVALTDFGLATLVHRNDQEEAWVQGTPAYMAPEQIRGNWRDQGPWTDLYSLGAMAWALVSGAPPFGREVETAQRGHLEQPVPLLAKEGFPPQLDGWVRRLMAKTPQKRFQRAAEALAALDALPEGTPRLVLPRTWREDKPALPPALRGPGRGLVGLKTLGLVGRESERDQLWAELRLAISEGSPRAVVLSGPTGHGKSRLAHWVATRAHELGVADWLDVRHEPDEGVSDPLVSMVLRAIRGVGLERSEVVARLGGDNEHVGALVQALIPVAGGVQFTSRRERLAGFVHFLMRRASVRPQVLWLDDVQWGLEALELAHMLMEREAPVLLLLTVQDEALAEQPEASKRLATLAQRPGASWLRVGPLNSGQSRQLVEELLGLSPGLAAQVAQRTGGNPLFAVQLVQDWVQRDLVEIGEQGFRLRPGVALAIPDSSHAVWEARLGRLLDTRAPEEAHSLELAAVLGQTVDREEWFGACFAAGLQPATGRVELLIAERLVRVGEGMRRWAFVHAMLRESLLRRAREGGRLRHWHTACVAMLGAREDARGQERRARHLLGAEAYEPALPLLLQAAERRLKHGDPPPAHALLDLRRDALVALEVPEEDERWGWQWAMRSQLRLFGGDSGGAQKLAEKAHSLGFSTGSAALLIRATRLLGASIRASDPPRAERTLMAAIEASGLVDDPGELARCRRTLADVLTRQGRLEESIDELELAVKGFGQVKDLGGVADCCMSMAYARRQQGDVEQARRWLEKAAQVMERAGNRRGHAACLNDLADLDRSAGRLKRAESRLRKARGLYQAVGRPTWVPEINLGLVLLAQNRYRDARAVLEPLALFLSQKGRSGLELHAATGLLPALAGTEDWSAFDRWMDRVSLLVGHTGDADVDLARSAELAASLCAKAGRGIRGERARELALAQWTALGRDEDVARLSP